MKLWFHGHLVDETTDLAINNLDEYDGTIEEYNAMRELYEHEDSVKLISHIAKMRSDQKEGKGK